MIRKIRGLGIAGGILAVLFIFGLNFTALEKQWDVPYVGVQKAHAGGYCLMGYCMVVTSSGSSSNQWGCWPYFTVDPYSCGSNCSDCG